MTQTTVVHNLKQNHGILFHQASSEIGTRAAFSSGVAAALFHPAKPGELSQGSVDCREELAHDPPTAADPANSRRTASARSRT